MYGPEFEESGGVKCGMPKRLRCRTVEKEVRSILHSMAKRFCKTSSLF